MNEFQNKVVFVSGAASGIGQAQALAFLKKEAKVFGVDIQTDFGELEKYVNFTCFSGDLSLPEECRQAVVSCQQTYGEIDFLLNTAGILDDYRNLEATDDALWQRVFATNLNSMFYLTKEILPKMASKNKGTIINMASIASLVAGGGGIAYTAAKHAVAGFTKQLALDYADKGLHINGIAPGAIQTPMNAADFAGEGEMAQWVADETPVKRWAQASEVAELTLFLASKQSSYIQGQIIPIDGGWLLK
ncbi:3-oxoacyl-ACP reductase [Enterococcus olivae]